MTTRIPATIVTGFLGAGKTTLISHLLDHAHDQRIALIINEFGDLGVDGSILEEKVTKCCENGIVELSNGCICCAVAEGFTPAMMSLIELPQPPDHIIIETSGLALPEPLIRAFNWPELRTRVTVDGVVTLIDGPAVREGRFAHDYAAINRQRQFDDNLDHNTPIAELFADQLANADIVIINKSDLLDQHEAATVKRYISPFIRPNTSILTAKYGVVEPKLVLGLSLHAEDIGTEHTIDHHQHSHHEMELNGTSDHDHDEFETFIAELPEVMNPKKLTEGIERVMNQYKLLRIKGFAAVSNRPMRLVVQAVGSRVTTYFDSNPIAIEPRGTRLIVIGQSGVNQNEVTNELILAAGG